MYDGKIFIYDEELSTGSWTVDGNTFSFAKEVWTPANIDDDPWIKHIIWNEGGNYWMNTVDNFDPETTDYTQSDNWPNMIENYVVQNVICPPLTVWNNAAGTWTVQPNHRCNPLGGDHCAHGNDCTHAQNCINELGGFICEDKCDPACVGNTECDGNENDGYTCVCKEHYTGASCETFNGCDGVTCNGNGSCVQDGDEPACQCDPGWDGATCDIQVPHCDPACTEGRGTCILDNGNSICNCNAGLSGDVCETAICDPVCANGGTCSYDDDSQESFCDCPSEFGGDACQIDLCDAKGCNLSNGSCFILQGVATCMCNPGWMGELCNDEDPVCTQEQVDQLVCINGNCRVEAGINTVCDCDAIWSGASCDIPVCVPACQNGGVCEEVSESQHECNCASGWKGDACDEVNTVCSVEQENNLTCDKGSCVLEDGVPTCECIAGFSGADCSVPVCDPACVNGTCIAGENEGDSNVCDCNEGFEGDSCETQIDPCDDLPCVNGSCIAISLTEAECDCSSGWKGDACDEVNTVCSEDQENNLTCDKGSCVLEDGVPTCECIAGFSGADCSVPVCDPVCVNGTCVVGENDGDPNICDCNEGFEGATCSDQIDPCDDLPCVNGVCNQISLLEAECNCNQGWIGDACDEEDTQCTVDQVNNLVCDNGACLVQSGQPTCQCTPNFTGVDCSVPICNPVCTNGGNCIKNENEEHVCDCPEGFSGTTCAIHACDSLVCINGDCIFENGEAACECHEGFEGVSCETQTCTCVFGSCDENLQCQCPAGFTGDNCENLPCQNCSCQDESGEEESSDPTCTCDPGFTGDDCGTRVCTTEEVDFCGSTKICEVFAGQPICVDPCQNSNPCLNGSECSFDGGNFSCECLPGYSGDECEVTPCDTDSPCENNSDCLFIPDVGGEPGEDGFVGDFACSCIDGWFGATCTENPCDNSPCLNGGACDFDAEGNTSCTCVDGSGGEFCDQHACNNPHCKNGGTCVFLPDFEYRCDCLEGFSGDDCEITPCSANPCLHDGECTVDGSSFSCECVGGFDGDTCEIAVCADEPCKSREQCTECAFHDDGPVPNCLCSKYIKVEATFGADSDSFAKNNNFDGVYENVPQEMGGPVYRKVDDHNILIYRSTIDDGWHFEKFNGSPNGQGQLRKLGLFVMQNGDDNACGNENSDGWEFQVSPGVYQAYADLPVSDQDTFAIFNWHDCEPGPCFERPCQNDGTCVEVGNGYKCECPAGFSGTDCEITPCTAEPCENLGTCEVVGSSYQCTCKAGYSGDDCEVTPCGRKNPCRNGGRCSPKAPPGEMFGNEFECSCRKLYTGEFCEDKNQEEKEKIKKKLKERRKNAEPVKVKAKVRNEIQTKIAFVEDLLNQASQLYLTESEKLKSVVRDLYADLLAKGFTLNIKVTFKQAEEAGRRRRDGGGGGATGEVETEVEGEAEDEDDVAEQIEESAANNAENAANNNSEVLNGAGDISNQSIQSVQEAIEGIACWSCSSTSIENCISSGRFVECPVRDSSRFDNVCMVEFRERYQKVEGITMGCADKHVCQRMQAQNGQSNMRMWGNNQCQPEFRMQRSRRSRPSTCRQCFNTCVVGAGTGLCFAGLDSEPTTSAEALQDAWFFNYPTAMATGRYWFDDTQLQTPAGVLAGIPTGANSIDDQNFTSDLDYVENMSNRVFWGRSHGDSGNSKDRNENDYTSQMIFWGLQDQPLDWWNLDLLSLQSTYAERAGLSEEIFQEN